MGTSSFLKPNSSTPRPLMTPQSKIYRRVLAGGLARPSASPADGPASAAATQAAAMTVHLLLDILLFLVVAEPQHAAFRAADRAVSQPLERCAKQDRVVHLPHRVMRRAREIDEHLLRRREIRIQLSDALWRHLLVVDAGDHQRWRLALADHRRVPSPALRLRRPAD